MKLKLNYFVIAFLVFLTSFAGSQFTAIGIGSGWYASIKRPLWTPSGSIIGAVWTILFILLAISISIFWNQKRRGKYFNITILAFFANALLNIFWSVLFFYANNVKAAFYEMIALELSILLLISFLLKQSKTAAYLLVPYAAWVLFATYLTYNILKLN